MAIQNVQIAHTKVTAALIRVPSFPKHLKISILGGAGIGCIWFSLLEYKYNFLRLLFNLFIMLWVETLIIKHRINNWVKLPNVKYSNLCQISKNNKKYACVC